jgi:CheY-like chemotaxis protein
MLVRTATGGQRSQGGTMQFHAERSGRPLTILMADDDEDDRDLTRDALEHADCVEQMDFVTDGQDLIDYLRGEGPYAGSGPAGRRRRPSIILLDLNMPRKDGREALAELKGDADLRHIPVVVLTTSRDEVDVQRAYDLGANSYITKPVSGAGLEATLDRLAEYWSRVVTLPSPA